MLYQVPLLLLWTLHPTMIEFDASIPDGKLKFVVPDDDFTVNSISSNLAIFLFSAATEINM